MPIRVDYSPAGAIGVSAFYGGQGDQDNAAKRQQLALQAQQMQADAQAKSQALATQLYMSQQGHDYDLYSRLAAMDNENQQLQYRTLADMAKQEYAANVDAASQYNQMQNQNAQLQYRTKADFASQFNQQQNQRAMQDDSQTFQEGAMRFQADKQAQQQQEEFRLRDELQKNQLQRHEQQQLAELNRAVAEVQQRDDLIPEDKANLITQLRTGINPLQQRVQAAQEANLKLQNLQQKNQLEQQMEWQKKAITDTVVDVWNEETGGTDRYIQQAPGRYSPAGGALKHDYQGSGGTSGSGSSGGGSGGRAATMPKVEPFKPLTEDEIHRKAMQIARQNSEGGFGKHTPYELYTDAGLAKDVKKRSYEDMTPLGKQVYNQAVSGIWAEEDKREKEHEAAIKAREEAAKQQPGKMTYAQLPPLDKRMVAEAADDQLRKDFPQLDPNTSEYARRKSAMVETIATNVYGDGTSKFIPKSSQVDGAGDNPAELSKSWTAPPKPNPITPDREQGIAGAKPLSQLQKQSLDVLGKMTIQAWTINAPLAVKETYARDASEAIALYKKYGSVSAMKAENEADYARWQELEKQRKDLADRVLKQDTGYEPATADAYREYQGKYPIETIGRAALFAGTSGLTGIIGRDEQKQRIEGRMRAEGIIGKNPPKPLPKTAQEAEAAARESARQWEELKRKRQGG